jgi:hypothetical protein
MGDSGTADSLGICSQGVGVDWLEIQKYTGAHGDNVEFWTWLRRMKSCRPGWCLLSRCCLVLITGCKWKYPKSLWRENRRQQNYIFYFQTRLCHCSWCFCLDMKWEVVEPMLLASFSRCCVLLISGCEWKFQETLETWRWIAAKLIFSIPGSVVPLQLAFCGREVGCCTRADSLGICCQGVFLFRNGIRITLSFGCDWEVETFRIRLVYALKVAVWCFFFSF